MWFLIQCRHSVSRREVDIPRFALDTRCLKLLHQPAGIITGLRGWLQNNVVRDLPSQFSGLIAWNQEVCRWIHPGAEAHRGPHDTLPSGMPGPAWQAHNLVNGKFGMTVTLRKAVLANPNSKNGPPPFDATRKRGPILIFALHRGHTQRPGGLHRGPQEERIKRLWAPLRPCVPGRQRINVDDLSCRSPPVFEHSTARRTHVH